MVFEEAWNEAEEQLWCAELAAGAGAGALALSGTAAMPSAPGSFLAAEPSLALPPHSVAEEPTGQTPPAPEIAREESVGGELGVLLPSVPAGAQQAFAHALTTVLPSKARTRPLRHQPHPPAQQQQRQQLLQLRDAQVAQQAGEGPDSAQQPVRAASCDKGLAVAPGLGADGLEADNVDADVLAAGLELADEPLPPLSNGLTHELSFVPVARPPLPPPPQLVSARDATEGGGQGHRQQHGGSLPHAPTGTRETEGPSAAPPGPALPRPRSTTGLRISTTNTVLPSRSSAEEPRPESALHGQAGGANAASGTQEFVWRAVLAPVEGFPAAVVPAQRQQFEFGLPQTGAATAAAKTQARRSRSGQLPAPRWPEHGPGGPGLAADPMQASSQHAASAIQTDSPLSTTTVPSATATGLPCSAPFGPSRSWRASLVSGDFTSTTRTATQEPSGPTASQHNPSPHLHHFRTFTRAPSNHLDRSNTSSFRNATTTSALNAPATAPHASFTPAPPRRSVEVHRTSAALASRNLLARPSAHIFKRLGQTFGAPSSSSNSLGAVASGAGSGTQPTRGAAHGISDHIPSSRLFSRGRKHPSGAVTAAGAPGAGPRERRTYRQQLLQVCYCQASGAGALGFAASARHASIAALLQPWLPGRPSLDAGSRGNSQQLVRLPSARGRLGRGRGGSGQRRSMTGHVPGVARAEEQMPSSSGDPEATDTGLCTSNDEQIPTAAELVTFGTLGILDTMDVGSPLDRRAGAGGVAGGMSGLLLMRTTSRGSSQGSFEVSGRQVSRAAATLPKMGDPAGAMARLSLGRPVGTSPATGSGGNSGASGDEQSGSEAMLTSGHVLPSARGSRAGPDEAGGRGSSQDVGAGVPQAPHSSERVTARGLAGRLRAWVGKALARDPRVSAQGEDGEKGQGTRGQGHRSMWSGEHLQCSDIGGEAGTRESHEMAAQHAGARAPADAHTAETPPGEGSSPDGTLPHSNRDTVASAASHAPSGSGDILLSQQASQSGRRQASPTDRRSVHVMDGARLAAAVAAGGGKEAPDSLQMLVRRAASHTAVLSGARGLTPQRRLPYPRQVSGMGPAVAAPSSKAAAFAFDTRSNAVPTAGGGPAMQSVSGVGAFTQRAAPGPGLPSTSGGDTARESTTGAGSGGSSRGAPQMLPGDSGGGTDPRVGSPDATVASTAHPLSGDGSSASGASPQLSPPPAVLRSPPPPPQLASSRMLRRQHSTETLWPGMFVNSLAAYGPSGPSRFFAAEVLHEINATRGALTGPGTENCQKLQQRQTSSGQGSASFVASGGRATVTPGESPPNRELATIGGIAAADTVRSLKGTGFTSRARMLLGLGLGKGVARGREGGQGGEAEGPEVPVQCLRVHAQRSAMSMTQLREVLRLGSFTAGARTNVLAGMVPQLVAQQQLLLVSPVGAGVMPRPGADAGAGTGAGTGAQLLPLPPLANTGGVVHAARGGAQRSISGKSLARAANEAVAREEARETQQQQQRWQRQGQLSDMHTEEGPAAVRVGELTRCRGLCMQREPSFCSQRAWTGSCRLNSLKFVTHCGPSHLTCSQPQAAVTPRAHSTDFSRSVHALPAHSRNVSQVSLRPALGPVGELEAALLPTPTPSPGVACPSLTQTQGGESASSMGTGVQAPHGSGTGHGHGHGYGGFVSRLLPHLRASGTGHTVPPSQLCFRCDCRCLWNATNRNKLQALTWLHAARAACCVHHRSVTLLHACKPCRRALNLRVRFAPYVTADILHIVKMGPMALPMRPPACVAPLDFGCVDPLQPFQAASHGVVKQQTLIQQSHASARPSTP